MALYTTDGINQLLTTSEAGSLFRKRPDLIRKWASLGHIEAAGKDAFGRKLYRLIDIARYEKSLRCPELASAA